MSVIHQAHVLPHPFARHNSSRYKSSLSHHPLTSRHPSTDPHPTQPTMALNHNRTYRSASDPDPPPPLTGTLIVTVGANPSTQRTWTLPKSLLARHSTHFAALCASTSLSQTTLQNTTPQAFQNYVDYMHSSIYTLNPHIVGFRPIHQNTLAAILGEELGAKQYSDAAMRQLHAIFEPLSRMWISHARLSPIRAADVEVVCVRTGEGSVLRRLFFDAVTSHWTQTDVLNIGVGTETDADTDVDAGQMGEEVAVTWLELYNRYPGFRDALMESLRMKDAWREALLRPVEEYLKCQGAEEGVIERKGGEAGGGELGGRGRAFARPRPRPRPFHRSTSSRHMRQSVEAREENLGEIMREDEEDEEAVVEEEDFEVDADRPSGPG
ncbi:hypothetical protein P153DRAFT_363563 [Dothidotthia symphoricarpi CBS 119687]|uniref:BTB domain-containing protein n=1 Tax=Dothidotthia symphoricarpi CBS 119687 TaxID=1392245 RepID=A0A6A6AQT3_9PLEO|nr:uncharacterized protein P153DRAFT_363563 [Dothidotthia symphoricarpi CBS 119687]KAF2133365.1 hypothetical protein P153DRAFT_363563 [Dothidotthia symphoricarpi CBS 119687]